MPTDRTAGKPTTRRYSPEEKQAAVRMVRSLQAETGMTHGAVRRVAEQLGYGVESVRSWVKQTDVDDGVRPGMTTSEAQRLNELVWWIHTHAASLRGSPRKVTIVSAAADAMTSPG
jgi:transposase